MANLLVDNKARSAADCDKSAALPALETLRVRNRAAEVTLANNLPDNVFATLTKVRLQ